MSRHRFAIGDLVSPGFPPEEWALLTHLPAQVVIAAIAVEPGSSGRPVVAGLAGIEAIAGGRAFDSDLVRAVVAAIFAEPDDAEGGPPSAGPVARRFADGSRDLAEVLANCRSATAVLAKADPADSAAYRQWLQSIAARVCEAACSGSVQAAGGERYGAAGRRLLRDLGTALALTP
jgi:hypothetical protein